MPQGVLQPAIAHAPPTEQWAKAHPTIRERLTDVVMA